MLQSQNVGIWVDDPCVVGASHCVPSETPKPKPQIGLCSLIGDYGMPGSLRRAVSHSVLPSPARKSGISHLKHYYKKGKTAHLKRFKKCKLTV